MARRAVVVVEWYEMEDIPMGGHYYDTHPPPYHPEGSNIVPWWRLRCRNCGRYGHTERYCDQGPTRLRCIYCGLEGHTVQNCPRRMMMQPTVDMLNAQLTAQMNADWNEEQSPPATPAVANPSWDMQIEQEEEQAEANAAQPENGSEDEQIATEPEAPPNPSEPVPVIGAALEVLEGNPIPDEHNQEAAVISDHNATIAVLMAQIREISDKVNSLYKH